MPTTKYSSETGSVHNLRMYARLATVAQFRSGVEWYPRANDYCRMIASESNTRIEVVCAMVAAISPLRDWMRNCEDARALIAWFASGRSWRETGAVYPTSGRRQLQTAYRIWRYGDPSLLSGPKVTAFYDNLLYPHDSGAITVDSHAFNAWIGFKQGSTVKFPISAKRQCESDYRTVAREHHCTPSAIQAVIWTVRKDMFGRSM